MKLEHEDPAAGDSLLGPQPTHQEEALAALAHALGIVTSFIGPGIVYFVNRDKSTFIRFHALQAAVFQLAIAILITISNTVHILQGGIFFLGIVVANFAFALMAASAANKGEWYEIPYVGPWVSTKLGM